MSYQLFSSASGGLRMCDFAFVIRRQARKKLKNSRALSWERLFAVALAIVVIVGGNVLIGCGTPSSTTTTTTTNTPPPPPPPQQPSYPSVPPVAITWSPSTSSLPAPEAVTPSSAAWGTGANDFPLTVSNPTDSTTVTSPINVVAAAKPTNPIFFMRVYVDQLAVFFTFDNSINTQIFLSSGAHTLLVMAEDNQGYIRRRQ
jgi:hypothetical protein